MSAEAPRGWRVTPTPRSWRAFWLSAAVRPWCWMKPSVSRPPVGNGPRHTASSALRRGVSCRCLRRTLPSGRVLPNTQNLPPEKQRICSSLTGPQNGTTFTLSSAPSAAGVLPGSGRWNGKETSSAVGAYALANGQAYMACGETVEALRGKGVGGRLIVEMANALAAEGWMPVFLCSPDRVHFYTRLGFEKMGSMQGMPRREAGLRAGGAGAERSFIKADCSLFAGKNRKIHSDFDALDPRERATPRPSGRKVLKPKNADRFAQRI